MKKAVILLSGGLDSITALAIAQADGFECYALSFRYGQRHAIELDCAQQIAATHGVAQHHIVDIDLAAFGGSALTDKTLAVPHEASAPPSPGPKCWEAPTSSSASTHSITAATPTAARNTSPPLKPWPTSPPKPAFPATKK